MDTYSTWRDAAHVRALRAAAVRALLHCDRDVHEAVHRGIVRRTRWLWGRVLHENHARVQSEACEAREETPLQEVRTVTMYYIISARSSRRCRPMRKYSFAYKLLPCVSRVSNFGFALAVIHLPP